MEISGRANRILLILALFRGGRRGAGSIRARGSTAREFENRSSLRRWLYAINECLPGYEKTRQRRSLPMDLTSPGGPADQARSECSRRRTSSARSAMAASATIRQNSPRSEIPSDSRSSRRCNAPTAAAGGSSCGTFAWSARECADLLETTTASVNSALLRARERCALMSPTKAIRMTNSCS